MSPAPLDTRDRFEGDFEPVGREPGEATVFACGLCGCRFAHGVRACGACPMSTGCELVKCPNCGFQFPRSSRVVAWARRLGAWFRRRS
jgi:hypothetical protein